MIYILKILFFYINFTIFTFSTTRLIFHNIKDNLIYYDEYNKYCYYINEDFLNNKIAYYRKCYEYINNVPADVKFKDYDKENAKNHLIICFCEIVEPEKDRIGKNLQDLNYKIEFDNKDILNKYYVDNEISTDDGKNKINKNNLKFELIINKKGVFLNYIDKTITDKKISNVFKTEKIDNHKWALFELKTKDDKIEIEVNRLKKNYKIKQSTKYLFVSDISSQLKFESCFKKKDKTKKEKELFDGRYYGLFENTYNYNIKVIFCDTENIKKLNSFFKCNHLESVENFESINTKNVTSMCYTFNSNRLKSINLNNLDTSKVKYMSCIFNSVGLEKIQFGQKFKTDNVKSLWFAFCNSDIKEIDLSNLNFTNVENISMLFDYCEKLEKVNMKNLNLEKIENLTCVFGNCENLKEINLDGVKFKNLNDISCLFANCKSLKNIDLSFLKDSQNKSLNLQCLEGLFCGCTNLEKINFGDNFDTSNVTHMSAMFKRCKNLKYLDLTNFNTSKVTQMLGMFGDSHIAELILPDNFIPKNCQTQWNDKDVERKDEMFKNSKIDKFTANNKTLTNNLNNYELFARYPDKYLKYGDKLKNDGTISRCCCCCNNCCSF